jgi:aspartate carbamoyltransferase regulatory subunit
VIDHLPVGTAVRAIELLRLPREGPVTVGLNVPSARLGAKDIVRVEGLVLLEAELARLALLGPRITVSIVEDGAVRRKTVLEVPRRVVGILECENPTCVTRHERVATVFERQGEYPHHFRCVYCERLNPPPTGSRHP